MTQAQRQTASDTLDVVVKVVTLIGGVLIIAGFVWGVTAWATGGLKPQIQVASDALSDKVNAIQGDISEIKQTLKNLPTPYEVNDQRQRMSRLDGDVASTKQTNTDLTARVTSLEQTKTDFGNRLTTLERLQWRQPH